jgi:hypothetical protein
MCDLKNGNSAIFDIHGVGISLCVGVGQSRVKNCDGDLGFRVHPYIPVLCDWLQKLVRLADRRLDRRLRRTGNFRHFGIAE